MDPTNGFRGSKIGNGEGFGSGTPSTSIRGMSVQGGDDFYVQKLDRMDGDWEYERANGGTRGLCYDEDMD